MSETDEIAMRFRVPLWYCEECRHWHQIGMTLDEHERFVSARDQKRVVDLEPQWSPYP